MVGMSTVCMRAHAPKELEEQANFTTAVVSTTTEAVSSTGAVKESSLQVGHFGHWPPCKHRDRASKPSVLWTRRRSRG
jgi:hypothetical protein